MRDLVGVGAEEAPAESLFGRRGLKVEQRSEVRIKSKQREARADKLAEALGRGDTPSSDGARGGQGREEGLKRIDGAALLFERQKARGRQRTCGVFEQFGRRVRLSELARREEDATRLY